MLSLKWIITVYDMFSGLLKETVLVSCTFDHIYSGVNSCLYIFRLLLVWF